MGDTTLAEFIKITNKDIYDKIIHIEDKLNGIKIKTSIAIWASGIAITLSCIAIAGASVI